MIEVFSGGARLGYLRGCYPGGEAWVRFIASELIVAPSVCQITAHLWSSEDVMTLLLVTDALRRMGVREITLCMPYLPYARQDRVANDGEPHSLRVFCDLINLQHYDSVTVWDVHSDVALGILNRVTNVQQNYFLNHLLRRTQATILVAPDAGAIKKTEALAKAHRLRYVRADKTRSTVTGELAGAVVYAEQHFGDDPFLIVDDICDGGRTFLNLVPELRKLTRGQVNLYVTHGIFSAGFSSIAAAFDKVYVANFSAHAAMAVTQLPANFLLFPKFIEETT